MGRGLEEQCRVWCGICSAPVVQRGVPWGCCGPGEQCSLCSGPQTLPPGQPWAVSSIRTPLCSEDRCPLPSPMANECWPRMGCILDPAVSRAGRVAGQVLTPAALSRGEGSWPQQLPPGAVGPTVGDAGNAQNHPVLQGPSQHHISSRLRLTWVPEVSPGQRAPGATAVARGGQRESWLCFQDVTRGGKGEEGPNPQQRAVVRLTGGAGAEALLRDSAAWAGMGRCSGLVQVKPGGW